MIKKDIRDLTISNPKVLEFSNSSINVILVSNFKFVAEGVNELTINKGDLLKFIDRKDNGWILVKSLDKLDSPGLIPASYVDIVINDTKNPINLNWLNGTEESNPQTITTDKNINGEVMKDINKTSEPVPIRSSRRSRGSGGSSNSNLSGNSTTSAGTGSTNNRSSSRTTPTSSVKRPSVPTPSLPTNIKSDYQRANSSPLILSNKDEIHFKRAQSQVDKPDKPLKINTNLNKLNIIPSPISPGIFKQNYYPKSSTPATPYIRTNPQTASSPTRQYSPMNSPVLNSPTSPYSMNFNGVTGSINGTLNGTEQYKDNTILSISISNCLTHDSRYWYRIDIKTPKERISIGKFYQDFYNLHLTLLKYKDQNLPKLPDPILLNDVGNDDDEQFIKLLMKRCNELNHYINRLLNLKFPEFLDWIKLSNNKYYHIHNGNETNGEINNLILPNSINLIYKKIVVKIINYNNDIITLNFNKHEIHSIDNLKFKIKQNINFKNLLFRVNDGFEPIENVEFKLIKQSEKILLRLQ